MIRPSRVLESVLVLAAAVNVYAQVTRPALKTVTEVFQQSVSGPERATLRLATFRRKNELSEIGSAT